MPLSAGTLISHYQILSLLGRGGMGEVYEAVDTNLSRKVAVKILAPQFVRSDEAVQRFIQEARAASALNHPNIITVYEVGQYELPADSGVDPRDRQIRYIAMELVEGETLRALVSRGALSIRERIDILAQVAAGLAKAHAAGIIHRDLKPENVMITTDGYAKVLDFGLAKLVEQERAARSGSTSPQLTAVGAILGTVGYMSPEQVRGESVDQRSDIFSFGAIVYEMLTGARAFKRGSSIETLSAILKEDPPDISESHPNVPPTLEKLVRRCLEKDRDSRFQTARDLAFNLETLSTFSTPNTLSNTRVPSMTGAVPAAGDTAHGRACRTPHRPSHAGTAPAAGLSCGSFPRQEDPYERAHASDQAACDRAPEFPPGLVVQSSGEVATGGDFANPPPG